MTISRRQMLTRATGAAATLCFAPSLTPLLAAANKRRFRIGACDWSIGKMADPAALDVAKQIGLDGVQVSLGTVRDDMHLRQSAVQEKYREASRRTGVAISSLAIGEMNEIPYKSDPRTIQWVNDCVDVQKALDAKVVLLAFFSKGDLKGDNAGTDEVVKRLKEVAPKAERAKVILGIESWLSAEESADIVQRVGSPAVKVYYDVANSEKMGYDIYKEIRWLGKQKLICEFHAKENDALLGQGRVDFQKVRQAMDEVGFAGWMQIEGAVPRGATMLESYVANLKYLRSVFPADA